MDYKALILISGTLFLLVVATVLIESFRKYRDYGLDTAILDTCRSRIRGWWLLFGGLTCALLIGPVATVLFFGLISFWALREYITLTPTRPADHRTLFWIFFILTPLQFMLVGINENWFRSVFGVGTYAVYSVLIPTYVFLLLPASIAVSGDPKFFLERVAKIQVGLLICVFSLSFAPALLTTNFPINLEPAVTSEVFAEGLENRVIEAVQPSEEESTTLFPVENSRQKAEKQKAAEESKNSKSADENKKLNKDSNKNSNDNSNKDSKDKKKDGTNATSNELKSSNATSNEKSSSLTDQKTEEAVSKDSKSKAPVEQNAQNNIEQNNSGTASVTEPEKELLSETMLEPTAAEVRPSFGVKPIQRPKETIRKTLSSVNLSLLFVFVVLVQMGDIFQYLWSALLKGKPVAPTINSNRTWSGVFCGAFTTALLAVVLWYFTPFTCWWQPAICGFIISLMGFAGSITMSAIKRDRGVADYGTLIEGHNGVLDRIDSLCFAAPVFYHLVWIMLSFEGGK